MEKTYLFRGIRAAGALGVIFAASLLITSCDAAVPTTGNNVVNPGSGSTVVPPAGLPTDIAPRPNPEVPPPVQAPLWDAIELMVRTDPAKPQNERYLNDWRFQITTIDDQGRQSGPLYYGQTDIGGNAAIILPSYVFAQPMIINAYNDVYPNMTVDGDIDTDTCRSFEIFVPANCYSSAVWLLGPVEDAVWDFYREAAKRRAEAWNPSQVDCGTWLANLQQLILTDRVDTALNDLSESPGMIFDASALEEAFQENQNLLVPTRPPICMAERRHNGGGMERAEQITDEDEDLIIDDYVDPWNDDAIAADDDPIVIDADIGSTPFADASAIVKSICDVDIAASGELNVNGDAFDADVGGQYILDDKDFLGSVHDMEGIVTDMDASIFNVRLGNGRPLDHDKYDDACALTTMIEFTNKSTDEQRIDDGSGVTFANLFNVTDNDGISPHPSGARDTVVLNTSDGDSVVDDNDYWAIFSNGNSKCNEEIIAVELLGHRQEDFRDVLHMKLAATLDSGNGTEVDVGINDLFIGLRAEYELNEETVDGELAYLGYTITTWNDNDGDDGATKLANISNCYEASDEWARQFFKTESFFTREDECCLGEGCLIDDIICAREAAEYAVRSQCFSNSRSNQRWQTEYAGFWAMNTIHGVAGNVVINPGWLAPNLEFEIYIQKFDEAVFKGPRTVRRTDDCGQLMAEIPTLVEGDRVLIKAQDNCCDDYDLVLPCVPEFTGFAGERGVPYIPAIMPIPAPTEGVN